MAGLATLGAALLGGHLAWALPFAWFSATFLTQGWLLAPAGSVGAAGVALTFGVIGTTTYMFLRTSPSTRHEVT